MKNILLVDYCGNCDANGNAIGHSLKVLEEYGNLLRKEYQISVALPECIISECDKELYSAIYKLPYQIVEEGSNSIIKRLIDKVKLFVNISKVFRKTDCSTVWFYKADFFLFLYLYLFRKPANKKVITLVYWQKFGNGWLGDILNHIFVRGMKKVDGVIYTQKNSKPQHCNTFYMPDYYYDVEKYQKYMRGEKENKVVCLGTMNPYKKLEQLVEVFNQNGMRLEILGKFYDNSRCEKLKRMANSNIIIENVILEENAYYDKLASARYAILPYDMNQYTGRTSGVLVETLFMQTIPIAPAELLAGNGVAGIGYTFLSELADENCLEEKSADALEQIHQQIFMYPTREMVQSGINGYLDAFV